MRSVRAYIASPFSCHMSLRPPDLRSIISCSPVTSRCCFTAGSERCSHWFPLRLLGSCRWSDYAGTHPDFARPFRTPFVPWVPILGAIVGGPDGLPALGHLASPDRLDADRVRYLFRLQPPPQQAGSRPAPVGKASDSVGFLSRRVSGKGRAAGCHRSTRCRNSKMKSSSVRSPIRPCLAGPRAFGRCRPPGAVTGGIVLGMADAVPRSFPRAAMPCPGSRSHRPGGTRRPFPARC